MFMVPAILVACALLGAAAGRSGGLVRLPATRDCLRDRAAVDDVRGQLGRAGPYATAYPRRSPVLWNPAARRGASAACDPREQQQLFWSASSLHLAGRVGWLLSIGIFSALFAITVAHELIHRRDRLGRVAGGILLSTTCFGFSRLCTCGSITGLSEPRLTFPLRSRATRFTGSGCAAYGASRVRRCAASVNGSGGSGFLVALRTARLVRAFCRLADVILARLELDGRAFFLLQSAVAILTLDWTQLCPALRSAAAGSCEGGHSERVERGACLVDAVPHHQLAVLNLCATAITTRIRPCRITRSPIQPRRPILIRSAS